VYLKIRPEYRITRGLYNYNSAWLKGLSVAAGIGLHCTVMRADRLNATLLISDENVYKEDLILNCE
jgi:hypothetical protein